MRMNKKQIAKYLKNPDHCPYCGGEDFDAIDYGFEKELDPFVWSKLYCICGKKWTEIYTLKTIEEVK